MKGIEIRNCENGYIVSERSWQQRHAGDAGREYVFESLESLNAWLKTYFEGDKQHG